MSLSSPGFYPSPYSNIIPLHGLERETENPKGSYQKHWVVKVLRSVPRGLTVGIGYFDVLLISGCYM